MARIMTFCVLIALAGTSSSACSTATDDTGKVADSDDNEETPAPPVFREGVKLGPEFIAMAGDFQCLSDMASSGRFRVYNKDPALLAEAVKVARDELAPPYPVGTIVQLIAQEAAVKRGGNFSPETNGWEFFVLDPQKDGTTLIEDRTGNAEPGERVQGCIDCHGPAKGYDFICRTNHGCAPIGTNLVEDSLVEAAGEEADIRCRAGTP